MSSKFSYELRSKWRSLEKEGLVVLVEGVLLLFSKARLGSELKNPEFVGLELGTWCKYVCCKDYKWMTSTSIGFNSVRVNFLIPLPLPHPLLWYVHWFLERGEGREGNIDVREKCQLVASCLHSIRDLVHNSGMCPDWELNLWPFGIAL